MIRGKIDVAELVPVLEQAGVERVTYKHKSPQDRKPGTVVTVCALLDGAVELALGYARLHPKDHFTYAVGRKVALRRSVERLDVKGRRAS